MIYGLLGKAISHSFSKSIHERSQPIDYALISTDNLADFFSEATCFAGNVTIPYKEDVLKYMDTLDSRVKSTQTANVIVLKNNQWHAYNTDIDGLMNTLKPRLPKDHNCLISILGNGATKRSLVYALNALGYHNYHVFARHPMPGERALDALNLATEVLINTTPVGSLPAMDTSLVQDLTKFTSLKLVYDVINNPLRTQLVLDAMRLKIDACSGIHMLFEQARLSHPHFGLKLHDQVAFNKIKHAWLFDHLNIVLIGMPFSGKTTLAQALSHALKREWIDTDHQIEIAYNASVESLFQLHGEPYFRNLEKDVVFSLSHKTKCIISTGGGIGCDVTLMNAIKKQSIVVLIDVDQTLIQEVTLVNRPLLQSKQDWLALYHKRINQYKNNADIVIKKVDNNTEKIMHELVVKINEYIYHQWA